MRNKKMAINTKSRKKSKKASTNRSLTSKTTSKLNAKAPRRHAICVRFPSAYKPHRPKSIMKFESLDDSLHAAYGIVEKNACNSTGMRKHNVEKKLRFGLTTVHFFENILGDNPATSKGPPVTIGWKPFNITTVDVDTFERHRPVPDQQRHHLHLALPALERHRRLESAGYTSKQIKVAVRDANKTKVKRIMSRSSEIREREEEMIENIRRKGRMLLRRKWGSLRNIDEEDELWTHANTDAIVSTRLKLAKAA